ncbi:MAG: DciA family protein [Hyphomonadaceae bacterium]|nr:DciA family protein [Hyphomonadaceae bacterium]
MLPKRPPLPRAPLPRPDDRLDPVLEEAAARALETRRGKPARRQAPPQAGVIASRVVRPLNKAVGGKAVAGKSIEALQRQWRDIVGDKIAAMTEPEKLSGPAGARILAVKVAGPAAPFIQHQIPLLLERCNLAGADLAGLTLKQGVIARPKGNVRPLSAPLSADEERLLATALHAAPSPRLKAALMKLGRSMGQRRA